MLLLAIAWLALATPADSAGTGWSLRTVALDVVALPDSGTLGVAGTLRVTPPAGGSSRLTLVIAAGMTFDAVRAGSENAAISSAGDTARLTLPRVLTAAETLTIVFKSHAAKPRVARSVALGADGSFASWYGNWYPWAAATAGSPPSMAASGELQVTMPAAWHSLASGKLVDSVVAGATRTETWRSTKPLAWSVIAADYAVRHTKVGATDVGVYLMRRQGDKAEAFAAGIPPMVEILSQRYGPYPFETFGLAAIPAGIAPPGIGGRSENGYFLTHEHALDADEPQTWIFAHELAHMWWANTVLSDPPGDDMVDEGMAAYGAVLVTEAQRGSAAARRYLRDGTVPNSAREFFHLWRIGRDEPLMNDYATLPSYSKGAWVYQMLRDRIGDSLFFATLRAIVRERAGRSTTLQDIRDAFVAVAPSGGELTRFFADWLDRAGAPVLESRWRAERGAAGMAVRVTVVQRTRPYRLPLELEVVTPRGRVRRTVTLADSVQQFVVPVPAAPTDVLLDPEHRLLLWEPVFGPISGVTPPLSRAEARAWLADDLEWLRDRYGVKWADVAVIDGGRVVWTARSTGKSAVSAATRGDVGTLASAYADTLAAFVALSGNRDTRLHRSVVAGGRTVVFAGHPDGDRGAIAVVGDERLGDGLAREIMQRIAVAEGWREIPGRE